MNHTTDWPTTAAWADANAALDGLRAEAQAATEDELAAVREDLAAFYLERSVEAAQQGAHPTDVRRYRGLSFFFSNRNP